MTFEKWAYRVAGIYGILIIAPMYFMEARISSQTPPAITHPEYFYGFVGVVLAWQVLFLLLSTDPVRYRPLMVATFLEKGTYIVAVCALFLEHRISSQVFGISMMDVLWLILFIISYVKTRPSVAK